MSILNSDMTDFGLRSQQDEEFKVQYDEQMELFKKNVLEDDEFSNKYGYLGDVYGKQWRAWKTTAGETLDQLKDVIEMIKTPDSRRLIVSAWNPKMYQVWPYRLVIRYSSFM